LKRPPTKWEIIFTGYTLYKGLITRIYRGLKKLNSPKINEPIQKWATEVNRTFSKEEVQTAKGTHEKVFTIPGHKGNIPELAGDLQLCRASRKLPLDSEWGNQGDYQTQ
jgi:hypothetical protein